MDIRWNPRSRFAAVAMLALAAGPLPLVPAQPPTVPQLRPSASADSPPSPPPGPSDPLRPPVPTASLGPLARSVPADPSVPVVSETPLAVDPLAELPPDEAQQLRDLIGFLVRQTLPTTYTNTDDWGETKFLYAGVKVRRDGWQLKTKRRYHQVNHGLWRRYTISLVDPQLPQNLDIRISDLRWDGAGHLQLQMAVDARLRLDARQSRWNLGAQLYSVHLEADARVRFLARADVHIQPDYRKLPPDLVIRPHVQTADLQLEWFDVHRLSSLHGDPADALGAAAEALLRRKWLEPQRERLAERINAQIERREDRLRLSISDWLHGWLDPGQAFSASSLSP